MSGELDRPSLGRRLSEECERLRGFVRQAEERERRGNLANDAPKPHPSQDVLYWKWSLDLVLARTLRLVPSEPAFLHVKQGLASTLGYSPPTAAQLRALVDELEVVARVLGGPKPLE